MSQQPLTTIQCLLQEARQKFGSVEGALPIFEFIESHIAAGALADRSREITGRQAEDLLITASELSALKQFSCDPGREGPDAVPRWMLNQLSRIGLATPTSGGYVLTPIGEQFLARAGEPVPHLTPVPERASPIKGAGDDPGADYARAFHEFSALPREVRDDLVPLRPLANADMRVCARSHPEAMYLAADVHKVLSTLRAQIVDSLVAQNHDSGATEPVSIAAGVEGVITPEGEGLPSALTEAGAPTADEEGRPMSIVDRTRWLAGLAATAAPQ
jgi:hypothetical protein